MTLLSPLKTILIIITFLILMSESIAMHKRRNNNDTEKCYGWNESAPFKRLSKNRTISEKLIITTSKSWGSSNDKITSAINTRTILEQESSITYTASKEPDETTVPAVGYLNGIKTGTSKRIIITKNLPSPLNPLESYETKVTTLSPAGRRFVNDEKTGMNSTEVNRSQVIEKTSSNDPKRRSRKSKKCKIKINSDKTKNDTFTSYLNNNTTRLKRRRMEIIKTEGITSNITNEITNGIPDNKRLENKDNVETTPNTIENSQINDHEFEDIASNNSIKNVRKAEITSIIPMKHLKPEETTLYVFENTQIQQSLINLRGGILEKKSLKLTVTAKNRTENHIELVTKFTEPMTVSTENYAPTEITVNTTENSNEFIINDDNTNSAINKPENVEKWWNSSDLKNFLYTAPIIRIVLKNRRKQFRHVAKEVQVLCDVIQKVDKNIRDTKYDCTIKY